MACHYIVWHFNYLCHLIFGVLTSSAVLQTAVTSFVVGMFSLFEINISCKYLRYFVLAVNYAGGPVS